MYIHCITALNSFSEMLPIYLYSLISFLTVLCCSAVLYKVYSGLTVVRLGHFK